METPFEKIADPKYYMVSVGLRGEDASYRRFLVTAVNSRNAFDAVLEKEMPYAINRFYSEKRLRINEVRYLGQLSEEERADFISVNKIYKEINGLEMPWWCGKKKYN